MIYLQLFLSFLKIGLLGFGGGMAIISLIQAEVERYSWMSQTEFVDVVAISQMTPGPIGINCATYVGYTSTGSIWGSVVATGAIILPSLVIMLIISALYFKIQGKWSENKVYQWVMLVIRAMVIGLIASAAVKLMSPESFIDRWSWLLFACVFTLTLLPLSFPKLKKISHPILLIILAGIAGFCIYGCSPRCNVDKQVDNVMQTLSTRQKVAQLVMVSTTSYHDSASLATTRMLVEKEGIGGVILMHDSLVRSRAYLNDLQSLAQVPLLVAVDGEWGPSMRLAEFPFFPRQMQLGALPDDSLVYQMGLAVGRQCRQAGIHINFAPVVDINNNPNNAAICTRSFGESPQRVADYGSAYMRGMQDAGIAACAKHFPGHGDTDVDSHRALPTLPFSRERLDSVELYPFRRLINDGVQMVMLGHLNVPALDTAVSSVSYKIVTDLLKHELGFKGLVVTDALVMKGIAEGREPAEVMKLAYAAGVDILLMPGDPVGGIDRITEAIESGEFSMEDLNERVRKVLALKAQVGLLDELSQSRMVQLSDSKMVWSSADSALIEEIARQSVTPVCLTPLQASAQSTSHPKVAFVGYHAEYQPLRRAYGELEGLSGFGGMSGVQKDNVPLAYSLLESAMSPARLDYFRLPFDATPDDLHSLLTKLVDYDEVVLAVHDRSGRPARELISEEDDAVFAAFFAQESSRIKTHVLYFGNPYAMNVHPWLVDVSSLIFAYTDTEPNERAAAQLLLGEIPSVGKLPVLRNFGK